MRHSSFIACCCSLLCATAPLGLAAESRPMALPDTTAIEAIDQCAELVKECFAYDTTEKTSCFRVSANHPFCAGSDLGKLAAKRWGMAPQQDVRDAAPALTGPTFVNNECVANFDAQLSGYLIGGAVSRETVRQLETALDACAKAPANEIFRP